MQAYSAYKKWTLTKTTPQFVHTNVIHTASLPVPHKKQEVLITICSSVSFQLHHYVADEDGRYLILSATIENQRLTLVNLWALHTGQNKFYNNLLSKLAPFRSNPVVLCGDFNDIIDNSLDTSNSTKRRPSALSSFLLKEDLYDLWRCKHDIEPVTSLITSSYNLLLKRA